VIVIVDYRMGNLGSIANMLKRIGAAAEVSSDPGRIAKADKLILPGVGSFDNGMNNLKEMGLADVLAERALGSKVPVLGICLGMQLMTARSEEGAVPGLCWIGASTVRFRPSDPRLKVPHMGWNVIARKKDSRLLADMSDEPRFYFVHSYHVVCEDASDVLATTAYGEEFVSAFEKGNVMGVQFHPEKSHKFGMKLLKNFAGIP
jgi:glutamine amidotransferase